MIRTARRKTSLPSIWMYAADLGVEEALGAAVGVEVPAEQLARARRRPRARRRRSRRRTAWRCCGRSQSVMRASVSVPMTRILLGADGDQPVGDDERVHEAGAGGVDVERPAAQAELGWHGGRRGRHRAVGRGGGEDDGVDRSAGSTPGHLERQRGRPRSDSPAVVPPTWRSRMPGALDDPLVARVEAMSSRSSLVSVFGGRAVPHPVMTAPRTPGRTAGMRFPLQLVRSQAIGWRGVTRSVGDGDVALQDAGERRADLGVADVAEHRADLDLDRRRRRRRRARRRRPPG